MDFEPPLVTAIMPTRGRRKLAMEALEAFASQTYPHRELVIVDDAEDPSFPPGADLGAGVRVFLQPFGRRTIGAKRNIACSRAHGDIIWHLDSDDWSASGRMADQVERLLASGAQVTGYRSMRFLAEDGSWWHYQGHAFYALGTSLCYLRSFWETRPFPDLMEGEDNVFVHAAPKIATVGAGDLQWARLHAGNTSAKQMIGPQWTRCTE